MTDPVRYEESKHPTKRRWIRVPKRRWVRVSLILALLVILVVVVLSLTLGGGHDPSPGPGQHESLPADVREGTQ